MRYLFTTLLLTAVVPLFAQKPFEGKIVYEVRSKADNKKAAMTIYFGRNNMRLEFIDSATKRQEDIILINLDSATIVTLKPNKSYKTSQLKRITSKTSIDTVKSIAGYEVERIALSSSGLFGILSSVINDPVLYVAKDLFYPVPGIYKGNPELLMINRNRIVIGAEFSFPSEGQWNLKKGMEPEASDAGKVSAFAYLVQSQSLDISLFQIPIGYEKQPAYSGNDDMQLDSLDSVTVTTDTTSSMMVDTVKPLPKKTIIKSNNKSPANKKNHAKQSVGRRREQ